MRHNQTHLMNPSRVECPEGKSFVWINSTESPGLYLEVRSTGKKSWFGRTKVGGKTIRRKLADASSVDYAKARVVFNSWLSELGGTKKHQGLQSLTVGDAFLRYFTKHVKIQCARPEEILAAKERYWSDITNKGIFELDSDMVKDWMCTIAVQFGKETANKQLTMLKACVNYLKSSNVFLPQDPFFGVKKFKSLPPEQHLKKGAEYERLMSVLDKHPGRQSDIIKLLLWTGARKSNVLSMQWQHLDLDSSSWVVQANQAKGREPIHVALSTKAIELIKLQPRTGRFVFATDKSESGHIENINAFWRAVRKEAGLEHLRIQDLRHTFGTWLAHQGENAFVIQKAMGHANIATTRRYVKMDIATALKAVEQMQACL